MKRAVDPEERAMWREAMRDVARRRGADAVPAHAGTQGQRPSPTAAPPSHVNDREAEPSRGNVPGLDRRQALRLRRGQLAIEARLDLHGMTQAEAHRALAGFVTRAQAAGKRVLLVITGKGTRDGTGVLRQAVPRWLAEPAVGARVLASAPAVPRDGGQGAIYLLLRRTR
jgi:DNA-nicking Smr family endonuclease